MWRRSLVPTRSPRRRRRSPGSHCRSRLRDRGHLRRRRSRQPAHHACACSERSRADLREHQVARLRIVSGEGVEQVLEVREQRLQIGRGRDNDVVLPDPEKGVSRTHAELRLENDRYVIVDLAEPERHLGERRARRSGRGALRRRDRCRRLPPELAARRRGGGPAASGSCPAASIRSTTCGATGPHAPPAYAARPAAKPAEAAGSGAVGDGAGGRGPGDHGARRDGRGSPGTRQQARQNGAGADPAVPTPQPDDRAGCRRPGRPAEPARRPVPSVRPTRRTTTRTPSRPSRDRARRQRGRDRVSDAGPGSRSTPGAAAARRCRCATSIRQRR